MDLSYFISLFFADKPTLSYTLWYKTNFNLPLYIYILHSGHFIIVAIRCWLQGLSAVTTARHESSNVNIKSDESLLFSDTKRAATVAIIEVGLLNLQQNTVKCIKVAKNCK